MMIIAGLRVSDFFARLSSSGRRIALLACALTACAIPDAPEAPRLSTLSPMTVPVDNPQTPEKIALGKQLFFDQRLSPDGSTSCEGCHYRHLGWTDGHNFSRRVDGLVNRRHTPTLYNVGYLTLWYWDGRAVTLEGQILGAWSSQMSADPPKVAVVLNRVAEYQVQFLRVFGAPASQDTIVKALAAYVRTLNSGAAPWDRYEQGDRNAVSADAIAGFQLFVGKARCAICHTRPTYTDGSFYNIGLEHGKREPDIGRAAITKDVEDTSAFKTPTLRSIAISGPYFHDGSAQTLDEAVRYMAGGGKPDPNKSWLLAPTGLTEPEIAALVAFLRSLTSDEPLVRPRIP